MSDVGKRLQAEAIVMFVAWLTMRDEVAVFGASIDASPAANLIGRYCSFNGLPEPDIRSTLLKPPTNVGMELDEFRELYDES